MFLVLAMVVGSLAGCSKSKNSEKTNTNTNSKAEPTQQSGENANKGDNSETSNPTTDEKVVVSLGIWPEDTDTEGIALYEQYKADFEALYPNVTIEPASYKYAVDTVGAMAEAGNLPTVFESWYTEPAKLINANYVADITDILSEKGWLDKMNPSIKQTLSSKDGRVYGIPRDGYALGLMINVEVFKEAGLVDADGYPLIPETWDQLAEYAQTITEKTDAAGLCLLAQDNAGGWHFSNIAWDFGATLTLDNGDGTYTANLNTPEAISAMEYVKSLKWKYNCLTSDPTSENWGTGFSNIAAGIAGMYIGANDAVNQPTNTYGMDIDNLCLAALPKGPEGAQYSLSGGTPYMFSATATKAEISAALDFLEFIGYSPNVSDTTRSSRVADAEYRVASNIPVIRNFPVWNSEELNTLQNEIAEEYRNVDSKLYENYFNAVLSDGNLRLEEPGPDVQNMYALLTTVIQAVLLDKNADVPSLMEQANKDYQAYLDASAAGTTQE